LWGNNHTLFEMVLCCVVVTWKGDDQNYKINVKISRLRSGERTQMERWWSELQNKRQNIQATERGKNPGFSEYDEAELLITRNVTRWKADQKILKYFFQFRCSFQSTPRQIDTEILFYKFFLFQTSAYIWFSQRVSFVWNLRPSNSIRKRRAWNQGEGLAWHKSSVSIKCVCKRAKDKSSKKKLILKTYMNIQ
jgi:hypothetical protein